MHYNLDYALRLCSQNNRTQSCVHIYSQMGLYEEAVNLALKVNIPNLLFYFQTLTKSYHYRIMIWNLPVSMRINPRMMKY